MITIDMHYGLIPLRNNDILNPTILSKTRLCARFGSTITTYASMSPTPKLGVNGKAIHRYATGLTGRWN